jgi:hypothetical protein
MAVKFAYEISLFILVGFFNMSWNFTTWDQRLYSLYEGRSTKIFITLKNPSTSAGFVAATFGSNCKHVNHKTTEGDKSPDRAIYTHRPIFTLNNLS